jgi:hypothetical protein
MYTWQNYEQWREKQLAVMSLVIGKPINKKIPVYLRKWTYPKNYGGATWYGWFVFLGRHRDSDELDECNFDVAFKMLGGEEEDYRLLIVQENHWAVGWVEWMAIHETAWDLIEKAWEIEDSLDAYAILDEEAYSKLQYENWEEYLDMEFGNNKKGLNRYYTLVVDSEYDSCSVDTIDWPLIERCKKNTWLRKFPVPSEDAEDDDGNVWKPTVTVHECTECDNVGVSGYWQSGTNPKDSFVCNDCIEWEERMIDENQKELDL